jgi:hypothetical protein
MGGSGKRMEKIVTLKNLMKRKHHQTSLVIKDDEVGNGRLKRNIGRVWVGKLEGK